MILLLLLVIFGRRDGEMGGRANVTADTGRQIDQAVRIALCSASWHHN